jgi:proteic killer suppression protein
MIGSFRDKGLKRFYEDDDRSKLPAEKTERVSVILAAPDVASSVQSLDRPGFRLHQLKGDRKNQWSITVRANWRIVFRFEDGAALDVDLVDYH